MKISLLVKEAIIATLLSHALAFPLSPSPPDISSRSIQHITSTHRSLYSSISEFLTGWSQQNNDEIKDNRGLHWSYGLDANEPESIDGNAFDLDERNREGNAPGWVAKWLALGGEGQVVVHLPGGNLSLPHRPSAFPLHPLHQFKLPISGQLLPYTSLPLPSSSLSSESSAISESSHDEGSSGSTARRHPTLSAPVQASDIQACDSPSTKLPGRSDWTPPSHPYTFALVERGSCDFAKKVKNAQERGAAGVIVGDGPSRVGESKEEGRKRSGLITMFSPEDTEDIKIPSVFVSRASYLLLMDLFQNGTISALNGGKHGLWIDIGEAGGEDGALGNLLTFALLMPSCFLLVTIGLNRIRLARQREQDRAPPLVVLSLPERVWQPDIVWEKEDESSQSDSATSSHSTEITPTPTPRSRSRTNTSNLAGSVPAPPPISAKDIPTPPAILHLNNQLERELNNASASSSRLHFASTQNRPNHPQQASPSSPLPQSFNDLHDVSHKDLGTAHMATGNRRTGSGNAKKDGKKRRKSRTKSGTAIRYYSKDECAICMDEFHAGDIVRILPCGHVFHKEECDEWLLKWRKLCPTCRADVTLPPGKPMDGAKVTPVSDSTTRNNDEAGLETDQSFVSRISAYGTRIRRALFRGEGRARGGENTPLLNRQEGRNDEGTV